MKSMNLVVAIGIILVLTRAILPALALVTRAAGLCGENVYADEQEFCIKLSKIINE